MFCTVVLPSIYYLILGSSSSSSSSSSLSLPLVNENGISNETLKGLSLTKEDFLYLSLLQNDGPNFDTYSSLSPTSSCVDPELKEEIAKFSLFAGFNYLARSVNKDTGRFIYEWDFAKNKDVSGYGHGVREAGALWGLSMSFSLPSTLQNEDEEEVLIDDVIRKGQKAAFKQALLFFVNNSYHHFPLSCKDSKTDFIISSSCGRYFPYPSANEINNNHSNNNNVGETGMQSLIILSLAQTLSSIDSNNNSNESNSMWRKEEIEAMQVILNEAVAFLWFELFDEKSGRFFAKYNTSNMINGNGLDRNKSRGLELRLTSPFSDGEALLALTMAKALDFRNNNHDGGKHFDYISKDKLVFAAKEMHKLYAENIAAKSNDENKRLNSMDAEDTNRFFLWGTLSLFEQYQMKWEGTDDFYQWIIDLSERILDVHQLLTRTKNSSYAIEGIIVGYSLILQNNDNADKPLQMKFKEVIDKGILTSISWQIGGPCYHHYHHTIGNDDESLMIKQHLHMQ